jgi:cellobiose phosphorylase
MLGENDRAYGLLSKLLPIHHALTLRDVERYRVEPYVVAADVYSGEHEGRGGWTWYTGAAGWLYRIAIEWVLGLRFKGAELAIRPCVPTAWKEYSVRFRYRSAVYELRVEPGPNLSMRLDGAEVQGTSVLLADDGRHHSIVLTKPAASRLTAASP